MERMDHISGEAEVLPISPEKNFWEGNTEEWRDVVGYEGRYQISNRGRVKSLIGKIPIMTQHPRKHGYLAVHMTRPGSPKWKRVHLLVLEAFVGPRPEGMWARHLNGINTDNRLENLKWGTARENVIDKLRHGKTRSGQRHHWARLTPDQVREIRASDEFPYELSVKYGVSQSTIVHAKYGVTYRDVK